MIFPAADAHCDFLYFAATDGYDIRSRKDEQCMSLDRMKEGNVALQFFAAWTDDEEKRRSPLKQFLEMADAYHRMLAQNSGILTPFTKDFEPDCGKIATVLTIENAACMEGDIQNIDLFYEKGVRAIALTWNHRNGLAAPATSRIDTGLTKSGRAAVKRMTELNIAIDFAHLSDRGIDQILEMTDAPVFSSHTNARDLFYAPRSMKNEHIREIAKRGGVIGVNFYRKQLTDRKKACISDIVDHICYIADRICVDCVAIGSDFDGMWDYPADLSYSGHLPRLAEELLRRGMSEKEVYAVMYGNLARYMKQFV